MTRTRLSAPTRVLVTGASGFLGRPAFTELQRRRFEVHAVTRHAHDHAGAAAPHAVDLLDEDAVAKLVRELAPSHILHLAWCTEHGKFWDDAANEEWATATLRLARAFADAGGTRFVLAGTCAQYDWSEAALAPDGTAHEASTPRLPASSYGRAKQATSTELEQLDGLSAATGLVFFPYGPHEKAERLVPSIARRLLRGEPAGTTPGTQERDFVHVADAGRALAALLASDVVGSVNIGSGEGAAVADVAQAVARAVGREDLLQIGALPDRGDEPPSLIADATRLREEVGFEPRFDLESGVRDAVEWWRSRT